MALDMTRLSEKGQVVIPKDARDKLGLVSGTVLRVEVEGKRVILEPVHEPPTGAFVHAGAKITEPLLQEAKTTSDKAQRLLRDLGVPID